MNDNRSSPSKSAAHRKRLKKIITYPAMLVAAVIVLFEELIWDKITDLVAWLARMRWVARLEAWVATLGPYPTLALFAVPILTLLPIKIVALYLIAHGRVGLGILVVVLAKVSGTAISARLFVIAKPKLMTFPTFVLVYNQVVRFKHWAHDMVAGWPVMPAVRRAVAALKQWGQRFRSKGRHFVLNRVRAARRYFKGGL